MIRFNYLSDAPAYGVAPVATTIAIDNRIRGPLAALIATVILTAAIGLVQLSRLHAAERSYAVISAQLAASNAAVATVKGEQLRVDAKMQLAREIADIRRASIAHASDLAWIGNHLPDDAWLTALRYENGSYSLEGTSDRIAAVAAAMLALRHSGGANVPRLISLRDDATGNGSRVHYTLQLEQHL